MEIDRQLSIAQLLEKLPQPFGRAGIEFALRRDPGIAPLTARFGWTFRDIKNQGLFLQVLDPLERRHVGWRAALRRRRAGHRDADQDRKAGCK